jgi:hypothetical protein
VPAQTIFQQNGGKGCRSTTFKDKMTIGKGADEVDLFYFGRGHTNGDAWVSVPVAARAARGGHLLGQEHPAARRQQRRQRGRIGNSLDKAYNTLNGKYDTIVTGHAERDDAGRSQGVRAVQPRLLVATCRRRSRREEPGRGGRSWKIPAKYQGYTQITNSPAIKRGSRTTSTLAWKETGRARTTKATK